MVLTYWVLRWPPFPLGKHPFPGPSYHTLHHNLQHPDHTCLHLLDSNNLVQHSSEIVHEKLLDGLRNRDLLHIILLLHPNHLLDSDCAAVVLSLCEEVLRD